MESLVRQHETVLAIKEELPVLVMAKVDNEEEKQQHSNYMETTESNLYIKSEEVDIKLEEIDYESINAINKEYLGSDIEEDFNGIDNLKREGIDIDENQFDLKNEADIKAEQSALTRIPVAVLSSNPEERRTLVQQNTLENITSTFETYPRVSKYISNQGKWKLPALLKCEQCSYEARCISRIHSHMRVHKDPSELEMYKCTQCNFKTKYSSSLTRHLIRHQDAVDIPRYKCNSCNYESKVKGALRRHICSHQKTSGIHIQEPEKLENQNYSEKGILKCDQCFYECFTLSRLLSHMRVHKDPSELDMYECIQCNFKTKHKNSLKDHSILHQNAADIPTYKCNFCDFETKRRGALIMHIRRRHNTFRQNNLGKHKP